MLRFFSKSDSEKWGNFEPSGTFLTRSYPFWIVHSEIDEVRYPRDQIFNVKLIEDVSNMLIRLEEPTKFVAIDEQTNNQIMHPFRLRKADRTAH